jgi:putative hydroxymethylpyrimidine transporter CytX
MIALWFGAAVSLAEILTGGLLAPLGWTNGLVVILLGHVVGAAVFFGVGWVSWKTKRPAIAVTEAAFGPWGPRLFGTLNAAQLLGWTVVMVIVGAQALDRLVAVAGFVAVPGASKVVLGALLVCWSLWGLAPGKRLNQVAVVALAALMVWVSFVLWGGAAPPPAPGASAPAGGLTFGAALELVVVMPLSWLPLVGDYTWNAVRGLRACVVSALAYAVGGTWMYLLGLGSAAVVGQGDPTLLLVGAVPAVLGIGVVLLSTVTTAFLDVHSARQSVQAVVPVVEGRAVEPLVAVVGTVIAFVVPLDRYQDFLGFIGAVLAPLYAVVLVHFLRGRPPVPRSWAAAAPAFVAWALGVALYVVLSPVGTPVGVSLPVMAAVAVVYAVVAR